MPIVEAVGSTASQFGRGFRGAFLEAAMTLAVLHVEHECEKIWGRAERSEDERRAAMAEITHPDAVRERKLRYRALAKKLFSDKEAEYAAIVAAGGDPPVAPTVGDLLRELS